MTESLQLIQRIDEACFCIGCNKRSSVNHPLVHYTNYRTDHHDCFPNAKQIVDSISLLVMLKI